MNTKDYDKIIYTVGQRKYKKIYIYGKRKAFLECKNKQLSTNEYDVLCVLKNTNIMYEDCLEIIIKKDIKSSLLNAKHKYKYMREFCKIMLKCGADIELADDDEWYEIKRGWSKLWT